jgi:uncharacterized protein with HEPN domain
VLIQLKLQGFHSRILSRIQRNSKKIKEKAVLEGRGFIPNFSVKNIPPEQRRLYPDIPWQSIAGMRDILVHEYWQADITLVWRTVQDFLPVLKVVVFDMLNQEV